MFASLRPLAAAVARNHVAVQTGSRVAAAWGLRWYSAPSEQVPERVYKVLQAYEGLDGSKITPTAHFIKDLGLDSLDAVELVILIEEEFGIVIPDTDAEKILSVDSAIDYVTKNQK